MTAEDLYHYVKERILPVIADVALDQEKALTLLEIKARSLIQFSR